MLSREKPGERMPFIGLSIMVYDVYTTGLKYFGEGQVCSLLGTTKTKRLAKVTIIILHASVYCPGVLVSCIIQSR